MSRFELPGLWELITPSSDLRLGWGLKQTCNSPRELSNGVSHFTCTPGLNRFLTFLLTITCNVDVQIAHARPFWTFTLQDLSNGIKNTSMQGVLTPVIKLWVFGSPRGPQLPLLGVWISSSHLLQSGVVTLVLLIKNFIFPHIYTHAWHILQRHLHTFVVWMCYWMFLKHHHQFCCNQNFWHADQKGN
jgi:hypothetical protein